MVWRKDHKAGTNADIRLSNTQSTKAKLKIHGLNSISKERKEELLSRICNQLYINRKEANYFLSISSIENDMYKKEDDSIEIIYNDGSTKDIAEASDMLNISLLSRKVKKYYVCYLRPEEGGH